MVKKEELQKSSLQFIVIPLSLAVAVFSLLVSIFLIFTNPSQFPSMVKSSQKQSDMVQKLKQDLASKLGISDNEIDLVSVEEKRWSDASLGCPKTDMMYAQVITPGYKILLKAKQKNFDYRTDLKGNIMLCSPTISTIISPTIQKLQ